MFHLSLEEKKRAARGEMLSMCKGFVVRRSPTEQEVQGLRETREVMGIALHSENKEQSRGFTQDNDRVTFTVENHSDCRQASRKVALTTM